MDIAFTGRERIFPARFARDRFKAMQKARSDRRRAARLRAVAQDHIIGAEQLREVMRGKTDTALRQIEAELVPHRAAQPGIDPWRRWPYALDQAADNDAVGLHQP